LWQFYEKHLRDVLDQQGTRFTQRAGAARMASPTFIGFFNRAAEASHALHSNKGQELGFDFILSDFYQYREAAAPRDIIVLIDGQSVTMRAASGRTALFQWRARTAGENTRSSIVFTSNTTGSPDTIAEAQGRWATFRIFYSAAFTNDAVMWSPAKIRPVGTKIEFLGGAQVLNSSYLPRLRPCVSNVLLMK
jgi:type VI protein secretion system component VasK